MPLIVRDSTNHKNVMLNVDGNNKLSVKDTDAKSVLDNINTALGGTLTVSQGISRSSATLNSSASITANDYTSSVDCNSHRKIAIYGTSSLNSQQLKVFISDDDTNYYENTDQAFYANASNGDYYRELDCVARYIKLQYASDATETTKYTLINL